MRYDDTIRKIKHIANVREWAILGLFCLLALLITYPTAARLSDFVVFATDPLLEAWTLKWDIHSFLSGWDGVSHLWEANIFYPYPDTLAFSEHLLPTAFLLLPFTLLGNTPLVAANLGVLFTTALSGFGMYLLVTWLTGERWAGVITGLFFAVSPFRMGHIIQLHLLSTQWLPFAFLAVARLIKLNRNRDLSLLLIFTNLQFLSSVNYAPLAALALAIWAGFFLFTYRRRITAQLWGRLLLFGLLTFALNWPVLRLYQQVSERMGIVRSLGDARIYGASMAHYLQPMANSLLYARWLGLPTLLDSAFPGLIIFVLAVIGLVLSLRSKIDRFPGRGSVRFEIGLALLTIVFIGFTFSFGANDLAFGESLAPLVARLLPYPYLYHFVPLLQGLRAPIRFSLLVTFGLAVLAGIGLAALPRRGWFGGGRRFGLIAGLLGVLILAEHLPAPFPGETVTYGSPVSTWLAGLPAEATVLELPYYLHTDRSFIELRRVYESAGHWQRLVNGASGFKPAWLVKLGPLLDTFPDWRSIDLAQQLGVNYIVLHHDQYEPADWDNLMALLPGYLPAIETVHNAGDDLILQLKPPTCRSTPAQLQIETDHFPRLMFANNGPAAFVSDPHQTSVVTVGSQRRQFLEPLAVAPGQVLTLTLPLAPDDDPSYGQVDLANLKRTLKAGDTLSPAPSLPASSAQWQPVQIPFANGAVLQAMTMAEPIEQCGGLNLNLQWRLPAGVEVRMSAELLDRFNRLVIDHQVQPAPGPNPIITSLSLPLAETTPPGQYQLRVKLLSPDGTEISAIGPDGTPVQQQLLLPVVIRPNLHLEHLNIKALNVSWANGGRLQGVNLGENQIYPGDWLRFSLIWQAEEALNGNFTVFSQLLGPDGRVWGQHDNPPKGGWYPTSLWRSGETVQDDYAVRLDSAAPPGQYRLIVGMYDPATGQRVAVTAGPNQGSDFVEAAVVTVYNP